MDRRALQRADILRVAQGEPYKHPVVDFLNRERSRLDHQTLTCARWENKPVLIERYVMENSGFMADGIEAIKTFTLEPLDLVAIWSIVQTYKYHRYYLATVVPASYAIQGRTNSIWDSFPKQYTQSGEIPAQVLEDHEGLVAVHRRLARVKTNLSKVGVSSL